MTALARWCSLLAAVALLAGCGGDDDDEERDVFEADTITVAGGADDVAAEPTAVWVVSRDGGTLFRVERPEGDDDAAPAVAAQVHGLPRPVAVAVGEGFVWVLCEGDDTLRRFDPAGGREIGEPLRVGAPLNLTTGGGWVWVLTGSASERAGTLTRVDPRTGRAVGRRVRIRNPEGSIAFVADSAWVGATDLYRVTAPGAAREAGVERLPVDVTAESLAAGEDKLWGTFGTLYSIDLSSGDPGQESHPSGMVVRRDEQVIDRLSSLTDVAVGADAVWVSGSGPKAGDADLVPGLGAVMRADPESGEQQGDPVVIGSGSLRLAVNEDGVWAASDTDEALTHFDP